MALRRWKALIGVLVAVAVAVPAYRWLSSDSRDTAGFLTYVEGRSPWEPSLSCTGGCSSDQRASNREWRGNFRWEREHPDVAISEGDHACGWLHHQPSPPSDDASGYYTVERLVQRYLNRTSHTALAGLSRSGQRSLVDAAFQYLCSHTRDDRTAAPEGAEDD